MAVAPAKRDARTTVRATASPIFTVLGMFRPATGGRNATKAAQRKNTSVPAITKDSNNVSVPYSERPAGGIEIPTGNVPSSLRKQPRRTRKKLIDQVRKNMVYRVASIIRSTILSVNADDIVSIHGNIRISTRPTAAILGANDRVCS